jgi:2-O-(6-phospho-alpha-D-mannosyl)-D-glycerate hydrolase
VRQPPSAEIVVVPHTHWDREWYEPFQRFRLRLVALLDDVIPRLEREPEFRFTLDGQTAAIDDYLEVRPEMEPRVAALVREGRLTAGPWRVLLDEFLCSGENIVRNLEMGLARAEALGGAMPVGYLPDMFGHCAQMPQILRRAGLVHACVWRGVPARVDRHAFRWVAPDGTEIRTEYLPEGYGNGADLFGDRAAAERMTLLHERMAPWFGSDPMLAMYGTDHSAPLPTLVSDIEALNAAGGEVVVRTLADYIATRDPHESDLPIVAGELRSHARANILPGVFSVRVHLKRAMAAAERTVERYAEPWAALWPPGDVQRFLDMAWQRLVDCSCHDSVTGCGVDETADQVAARLAEAEQIGRAVRDLVLARLSTRVPFGGWLVANPTPRPRTDLVEIVVAVPRDADGVGLVDASGRAVPAQEVGRAPRELAIEHHDEVTVLEVFRRIHRRQLFGRLVQEMRIDDGELLFELGRVPPDEPFDPALARDAVAAAAAARPGPWTLRLVDEDRRTLVASVSVPALGWTGVSPVARRESEPGTTSESASASASALEPATESESASPLESGLGVESPSPGTLSNGLLTVSAEAAGTLRIVTSSGIELTGVGRLVDGGDRGDTYNYAPPADDTEASEPVEVSVALVESGPLRGRIEIVRRYAWPIGLTADLDHRTPETATATARTMVELRVGEPFVRLRLDVDNPARDHRLRLHVPTVRPETTSAAEGQFAVTTRDGRGEGGWGETPLPTYPASAFVDAGGVSLLLTQPTEYELCSDRELAVTVLRAVGQISRNVHPLRAEPAGPEIATPQAQQPGGATCELAILPHGAKWSSADPLGATERYRHGFATHRGRGSGLTGSATGLLVEGDGVTFSSLRRRGDRLELRLVAQTDRATSAHVTGDFTSARRCDLRGVPGPELDVDDGRLELALAPWEIATVQLS